MVNVPLEDPIDDGDWLPSTLDPSPLELASICERAIEFAKACDEYSQTLAGQDVSVIFDRSITSEHWRNFQSLATTYYRLGTWNTGDVPLALCEGETLSAVVGWRDTYIAGLIWEIYRSLTTFQTIFADILPYARQIRWAKNGSANQVQQRRVWYAPDEVDFAYERLLSQRTFISERDLQKCQDWLSSLGCSGSEVSSEMYLALQKEKLEPYAAVAVQAITKHRRQLAREGEFVFPMDVDDPFLGSEVELSDGKAFPILQPVLDDDGRLLNDDPELSTLPVVLTYAAESIVDMYLSDFETKFVTDGFGRRQLTIDLCRVPWYRGYSKPRKVLPFYRLKTLASDVFEQALEIEASEGVRLRDGGDAAWFVECYDDFKLKRENNQTSTSFREYSLHRFFPDVVLPSREEPIKNSDSEACDTTSRSTKHVPSELAIGNFGQDVIDECETRAVGIEVNNSEHNQKSDQFSSDGLHEDRWLFIWGGVRFEELTDKMFKPLQILTEAYRSDSPAVSIKEFKKKGVRYDGGFKGQIFKVNRPEKIHRVASIVEPSGTRAFKLADPSKVMAILNEAFPEDSQ